MVDTIIRREVERGGKWVARSSFNDAFVDDDTDLDGLVARCRGQQSWQDGDEVIVHYAPQNRYD